jgi:hypothetical protein
LRHSERPDLWKKEWEIDPGLHAGQPVNADGTTGGVTPELDELLDGEDAGEILDASTVFGMPALELVVSLRGPRKTKEPEYNEK